jgi:hypothetical protein
MSTEKAARQQAPRAVTPVRHREATDPLHAYEQFGRIDVLEGGLAGSPFVEVSALANLAQQQLDAGYAQNARNLLCAAEHLSFAGLAPKESARLTSRIPAELKAAVAAELRRLIQNAEQRWSETANEANRAVIEAIYAGALKQVRDAFDQGAYRRALQLARAAEALAHVTGGLPSALPGDREIAHRRAS